ncbi:DUF4157 domain-containing protein (plasmid) [Rhizobium sp. T1470]|uniref:eCIS core domain-containing protein n=1 Tax=unclassified Rhizobium TaxID=2613769 RepID=UPI001CD2EC81|nr:DUF4157 domain-containing protein [Rhizobium sp. T1473]
MQVARSTTAIVSQSTLSAMFRLALILLGTLIPASLAHPCAGISDVAFTAKHGGPEPGDILEKTGNSLQDSSNAVTSALQSVVTALNEIQASVVTGPLLERALVKSRNDAISGSMPIPPYIREQLTGYATEDSMNRVRYKIGNDDSLDLAQLLEKGGFADAVTLIDVVVFREPSAAANVSAWAHELTHVDQFRDWGVHNFAVRYARNWRGVESPAYAKGDGFCNWRQSQNVGNIRQALSQRPATPMECNSGSNDE